MIPTEIQYDLFHASLALEPCAETFELLRSQKWKHGPTEDIPLVAIELVPHQGRWMWATRLNSLNGSGQGSKALPKWGKFADTKAEALLAGADEVRTFMHRATELEQKRIAEWLSEMASRAVTSF